MSKGKNASDSGQLGEVLISDFFENQKIPVMYYRDFLKNCPYYRGNRKFLLVKQFSFEGVFGTPVRCDFALIEYVEQSKFRIRAGFEVKTQNVPGSVDEKLPYVRLNLLNYPFIDFGVLVCLGKYWEKERGWEAVKYMKRMQTKKFKVAHGIEELEILWEKIKNG